MKKNITKRKSATDDADVLQINKREPLTYRQAELLADAFLSGCGHEAEVINPLLIILDDLQKNCFDGVQVDTVVAAVIRRCYAGTYDADTKEDAYIEQVRGRWAKPLEAAA